MLQSLLKSALSRRVFRISLKTSIPCRHKQTWEIPSSYTDVHIPDKSLTQFLFDVQEPFMDRTAMISGETGEQLTHGDVRRKALKLGSALTRLGVSKGDIVAIYLPNCVHYGYCLLGISSIGAAPTTISYAFTAYETKRQIENSEAVAIICDKSTVKNSVDIFKTNENVRHVISIDSEEDGIIPMKKILQDDGKGFPKHLTVNPEEDIAVLPYSSGTSGLPKGVLLTHRNLVANIQQSFHPDVTFLTKASGKFQERMLIPLPLFHIYGMSVGLFWSIMTGGSLITMKQFETSHYVELFKKYQPTTLITVPMMLNFLCEYPKFTMDIVKESHAHSLFCGAAPIGQALMEKFQNKFAHRIRPVELYGMTETSPITHSMPKNKVIAGSCGLVVPNTTYKLVDVETGENVGPLDGKGEMFIKGPQVMRGYLKNEKATADTLSSDGWLRTGDVATMDEGYHLYVVDRVKDLMKVKGFQVAPAEVEHVIRECPGVLDVGVVAITDERAGQVPKAFVVPAPGSSLKKETIIKHVEEHLSKHKHLSGGVEFLDEIPRTKSGKIQRQLLIKS